jgi:hypothetical protein
MGPPRDTLAVTSARRAALAKASQSVYVVMGPSVQQDIQQESIGNEAQVGRFKHINLLLIPLRESTTYAR